MLTTRSRMTAGSPPISDADLLDRVARDDRAALGALYERHAVALLRFVRRTDPHGDPEDVVQATFLTAKRIAASFDRNARSAGPWLFAIARGLLRVRRRSFVRFSEALQAAAQSLGEDAAPNEATRFDLDLGIRQLSQGKRVVLLLELEGFKCEEIAEMLNIPVGTVWTRLHHARRELRRFLAHG